MRLRTVRRGRLAIALALNTVPALIVGIVAGSLPMLVFFALVALPAFLIPGHLFERWFLSRSPPG